ncbi:N-acetylmannosaminyltransferase [Staphylococcus devriesei]|uniref:N-acetylglucosaminyldiphosphoundecaprenol N-acetyl-beta-D-mannosaminyltransferase n=1 Tax=Staphylococcus devriesei TaxID=586733 RepID=A0A2T4KRS8_9STAP|nr:N-acetylglucosaminyldiphosphoundecaprenol N-acetyl-beta-D-mannosaminyltransferase TarA [Staphylococcus devriesei]PTF05153.1 N-acetylmannosaminyltransferase [Staphylococcus devriesei]PTF14150.1 N-acetylmannosaminyltransferase [Staphylococcus devriesei]
MCDQTKTKTDKVDILGVHFDNVTMLDMIENVKSFFTQESKENLFIVTANPEIVDYATEHVTYRTLINSADYIVPDGTGIIKAANRLKTPLKRRVPGIELMEHCLKIAHTNQQKVYLLGAKNEVIELAYANLQRRYPQAQFDYHHGYINLNDETVIKRIKRFNPDYIFVGMGFPKQEEWIEKNSHVFEQTVLMGVGGSFEIFSNTKKRAPKLFQRFNIEWVYRVLIDWKRIGRMRSIPKFMFKVLKVQRKMKKNNNKK